MFSKCFNELRKEEGASAAPTSAQRQPPATPTPEPPATTASPAPLAEPAASVAAAAEVKPAAASSPMKKKKKKKKKKTNYKNMIAGMMEASGPRDAEKEKESIQKVTGAGAFVKFDKNIRCPIHICCYPPGVCKRCGLSGIICGDAAHFGPTLKVATEFNLSAGRILLIPLEANI